MATTIDQLLQALGQVLALPALALNSERVCGLYAPGGVQVQMEWVPSEQALLLMAGVGQLDSRDPGGHAQRLLQANFLFAGTRGETIALEPETQRLLVCARLEPAEVSLEHAVELFSRFVDTAQRWHDHLHSQGDESPALPEPGAQAFMLKG